MKNIYAFYAVISFAFLSFYQLNAQTIDNLDFGNVTINTQKIDDVQISAGDAAVDLVSAKIVGQNTAFSIVEFIPQRLAPNAIVQIPIKLTALDNIRYYAFLVVRIKTAEAEYSLVSRLTADGKHSNPLYSGTDNLFGSELITWLSAFVKPHTVYSYKDARTKMWGSIDNVNGEVECIYTGRKVATDGIPDVSVTKFDTEHTWPQSLGADSEPPKSDLFHIRPTWQLSNSKRANYPFGFVTKNVSYEDGGSKLGLDEDNVTVFEPRDKYKGDVARGMYYFAIRYGKDASTDVHYIDYQENALRQFMLIDPVDQNESARNDSIFAYQKNRNPFIDNNQFVSRFKTIAEPDFPKNALVYSAEDTLYVLNQNGTFSVLNLYNAGDTATAIRSILINNFSDPNVAGFHFLNDYNNISINPKNNIGINIDFYNNSPNGDIHEAFLDVEFENGQKKQIVLKTKSIILSAKDENHENDLDFSIFPNPVTSQSKLILHNNNFVTGATLQAVTLDGRSYDLSHILNYGQHNMQINRNELPCTNCVLFFNLKFNNHSVSKPIIVE